MGIFNGHSAVILTLLFLIVTFVQSSIEKITDWKGSVSYIVDHFKFSPLRNSVPFLLGILLILEIISSAFMGIGIYKISTNSGTEIALIGVEIASISLIFMLIGQRLAKDYEGSTSLATYFIIALLGMYLLQ